MASHLHLADKATTYVAQLTSTATVLAVPGLVSAIGLRASGGAATMDLVDAATAVSTPVVWGIGALNSGGSQAVTFSPPIRLGTGIRVVLSVNAQAYVAYRAE